MPKASELKSGMVVTINDLPHIVKKISSQSPSARGAQTLYKIRFNNAQTGQKHDETFKSDDLLTEADFQRCAVQYLYADQDGHTFMNTEDYSQYALHDEAISELLPFLHPDLPGLTALLVDGECVTVVPPNTVELEITDTPPAMKSASASSRTKPATLSTGLEVQVPEYLAIGEIIKVSTDTKEYLSRA